jgi:DNA-binding CsgD family transcriptional regulator
MPDHKRLLNTKVLVDLASQLQDSWQPGHEDRFPSVLRAQLALLEEMAVLNKCVFSLFDFEKNKYIFHTKNLFDFIGLELDLKSSKWDSSYLSLIEDRDPIKIFLALREKFLTGLTSQQRASFQSIACGSYLINLKGQRLRGMYRAWPLTYDKWGNVKLSFDSVSNIKELMLPKSGHWIRFATGKKINYWHSQNDQVFAKDILSPREIELISLWKSGLSIPEIADHCYVSPHTVKNQLTNARQRLLARDNTSLAQLATLMGVLKPIF